MTVGKVVGALALALTVGMTAGAGVAGAAPPVLPRIELPPLPPLPQPFEDWLNPPPPIGPTLTKDFAALEKSMRRSMPGRTGIAIVPVGGDRAVSLGKLTTGRAWSTLKVPVALAAEREVGYRMLASEDKAITLSDNDAAGELWGALGGGQASVDAVTAVLREGHDLRTRVSSEADDPPSYPGYTAWALADQARFGAHLPCMANSDNVIRLMGRVASNQRWGIARPGGAKGAATAVKGGWGPYTGTSGGYLVRQFGIITTSRGQVAVALAAVPKSGKFSDGTKMLNRMGAWLDKYLGRLPVGRC